MKVIIDTCVFFRMIEYSNFVQKYGKDRLPDLLKRQQLRLDRIQSEIEKYFDDEFNKKYGHLTFEEKIDAYKEYIGNKRANLEDEIEKTTNLLNGFTKNKDGSIKYVNLPPKRIKELSDKLIFLKQRLAYYQIEPTIDFNDYKLLKDSLLSGRLYQKALDGDVDLCITSVAYREILNHTNPKPDNPHWKYFSPQEVGLLTKNCTLISTHSQKVLQNMQELAERYRQPTQEKKQKQMAEDVNSVGEYGDSLIMAGANMSGIILLTHNAKDFIWDKSNKSSQGRNTYIRNYIQQVSGSVDYGTDALCYTVEDFLNGNYRQPMQHNSYSLMQVSNPDNNFVAQYKLCDVKI